MEDTITPAAYTPLRQRIVAAIATAACILAMLLGGGAPHDLNRTPKPTPIATITSMP